MIEETRNQKQRRETFPFEVVQDNDAVEDAPSEVDEWDIVVIEEQRHS